MKQLLKNNLFLLSSLIPLVITFFLVLIFPQFSKSLWVFISETKIDILGTVKRSIFYVIGVFYLIGVFLYWALRNREALFSEMIFFRQVVVFLLSFSLFLCFYVKIVYVLVILVNVLLIIDGVYHKKRYSLDLKTILFFLYILLQFVGVFWNLKDSSIYLPEYIAVLTDQLILLLIPITLYFFRFTSREQLIFITIIFKFFLFFIILHLFSFLLVSNFFDKNILSCFTFNKQYINRYLVFQFSEYMHPSIISWLLLIIGGVSYSFIEKGSNLIKKSELVIYWISLLFFIFIVQSRVAQIGYFVVLAFILFFELSKLISKKIQFILVGVIFISSVICLYGIINFTSIFSDNTRIEIYTAAFESFKNHYIIGSGTFSELNILDNLNYLEGGIRHFHNDFLQTLVRFGFSGLLLLMVWIFMMFKDGLKNKSIFFFILPTLLIMMTDSAFNHLRVITITSVFLLVFTNNKNKVV